MRVRKHIYINGMVQAVFFRFETSRVARENNVRGWVRNLPDGRVEAVLEGEAEPVDKVLKFCKKGPPGAIVKKIEVFSEPWKGEFKDFNINY